MQKEFDPKSLDPQNPFVPVFRLMVLEHDWAQAEIEIKRILNSGEILDEEDRQELLYYLGGTYAASNQYNRIEEVLQLLDSSSLFYLDLKAEMMKGNELFYPAIRLYSSLIHQQSYVPRNYYNRAICHKGIGDFLHAYWDFNSLYVLLHRKPDELLFDDNTLGDASFDLEYDRNALLLEALSLYSSDYVSPYMTFSLLQEILSFPPLLESVSATVQLISDFLLLQKYLEVTRGKESALNPIIVYYLGGAANALTRFPDNINEITNPQLLYYYFLCAKQLCQETQAYLSIDQQLTTTLKRVRSLDKKHMKSLDLYYCALLFFLANDPNNAKTWFNLARKRAQKDYRNEGQPIENQVYFYADKMHRYIKKKEKKYSGYNNSQPREPRRIQLNEGLSQYQWYFFESETLFEGNNKGLEPIGALWEYYYLSHDDRKQIIETIRFYRALEIRDQISQIVTNSLKENPQIKNDDLEQFLEGIEDLPEDRIEERVSSAIDAEYFNGKELSMLLEYLIFRGKISIEQWIALSLYSANDDNAQLIISLLGSGLGIFTIIPALVSLVLSISANLLRKDKSPNDYPEYKKHVHEVLNDVFYKSDERLFFEDSCPSEETIKKFFQLRDNQKR